MGINRQIRTKGQRVMCMALAVALLNLGAPAALLAQKKSAEKPAEPQLTLEAISRDPGKWIGTAPAQIRWSEDGGKLYFNWNPERGDRNELYELDVRAEGATPVKVPLGQQRWLSSNPGVYNAARTMKAYAFQGDIYLHEIPSGKTRQITQTVENESNPRFSKDGRGLLFTRGDNLYEWDIASGAIRQWTDFRRGRDPEEKPKLSKEEEYLEKQQLEMFEIIQKLEKNDKENKERTKTLRGEFPEATYLKENEAVSSLMLSPDRKRVTFVLTDRSEPAKAKIPEMPKYVTKSGYTEMERLASQIGGGGRYKVGVAQNKQKLGAMTAADGKVAYFDPGLEKREHIIATLPQDDGGNNAVCWSDDGQNAFVVLHAEDNTDRWVMLLDFSAMKTRVLDTEHDDAWLLSGGGPFGGGPYGWLDNSTLWFRSERDGYFHVYSLPIAPGSKPRQLTSGKWEVTSVQLSRDKSKFFLTTSEPHPGERQLYTLSASGGARTRLTTAPGVYAGTLSPDEKWIAATFASPDANTDLYLMENRPGATPKRLTDSYTDEFKGYKWRNFDIVQIPDTYGNQLYARLYKPEKPHPARPAVIYVHGAGYAQSVFRNWGGANTTPFFNVLLQAGYTVLDLDYRGSSGYGRDCRTDIYRNMGGKDIDSAVSAARWLAANHGIDPRRIGIFGGSYGGFFTLMALFKHPGVFAAGAALYPVTDWAHYNHPYTSNILNNPYEDDEAYRRSSPIYHAAGLQDRLLILHGMFDRNVHFQDTVRLTQRLIELKKTGWSLAAMPVEDHGWQNEFSRLDSNRRIFALFEEVLKRPLPALKMTATAEDVGRSVTEKK